MKSERARHESEISDLAKVMEMSSQDLEKWATVTRASVISQVIKQWAQKARTLEARSPEEQETQSDAARIQLMRERMTKWEKATKTIVEALQDDKGKLDILWSARGPEMRFLLACARNPDFLQKRIDEACSIEGLTEQLAFGWILINPNLKTEDLKRVAQEGKINHFKTALYLNLQECENIDASFNYKFLHNSGLIERYAQEIKEVDPETWAKLQDTWEGSLEELLNAVRSLGPQKT